MRAPLAWTALVAAASLATASLAAGCSGGTYVTVTLEGNGPALASVARIDLDLQLAGKNASATLTGKGGNISFPTTTVLEVASGDGSMTITANAIDAAGNIVAQTMGTATVQKGKSTTATLAFGGGGGGGGGPDLAGGPCSVCDAKATCSVTGDTATCACPAGYTGDGKTCTDVDECAAGGTAMCDANATCNNIPGSFTCSCKAGYQGSGFMCTQVWVTAKMAPGFFLGNGGLAVGNNNLLYFVSPNTTQANVVFKSWDVTTGSAGALNVETPMPAASNDFCNCGGQSRLVPNAAGTSLYYFGNYAQIYSVAAKTWSTIAGYRTPTDHFRGYSGVGIVNGIFYWVGDYQGATNVVQTFDTGAVTFSTATAYPIAIEYPGAVAFNNKLYVFGGDTVGGQRTSAMYAYDPTVAMWTAKANAPSSNDRNPPAVAYKNQIWALFGTALNNYEPNNDAWLSSVALPGGGANWQIAVSGAGTSAGLYALGDFPTGMTIYKYNLP